MKFKWVRKLNFYALALAVTAFSVYFFTFPREIGLIDSGLMGAAAVSLGIPLPTGFPSYLIIAHIFSIFPFGDVTSRLYFLSIFSSVAAVLVVFEIIKKITLKYKTKMGDLPSFVAAVSLAFSYQFWSSSINIETFALTQLCLTLILFLAFWLREKFILNNFVLDKKTKKVVLVFSLLLGFSAGLSPTIITVIPGLIVWILFFRKAVLKNFKLFLISIALSLSVFVLIYSYLPLRAITHPYLNFGTPDNLKDIISLITGSGFINKSSISNGYINVIGFTLNFQIISQSFSHYLSMLIHQYNPLFLPIIALGALKLYQRKSIFYILIAIFIADSFMGIFYITGNQENWLTISWIILSIFLGVGINYIFHYILNNKNYKKLILRYYFFAQILIILLSFLPVFYWFAKLDRSKYSLTTSYIKNLYSDISKNAVIIGGENFFESQTAYAREALKLRKDVLPIAGNLFYDFKWYRENIIKNSNLKVSGETEKLAETIDRTKQTKLIIRLIKENPGKNFYITNFYLKGYMRDMANMECPMGHCIVEGYAFIPYGLVYKVVSENKIPPKSNSLILSMNSEKMKKPFYLELLNQNQYEFILYDRSLANEINGDYYLFQKKYTDAEVFYKYAKRYMTKESADIDYKLGIVYLSTGRNDLAKTYLQKAQQILPDNQVIQGVLDNLSVNKKDTNTPAVQNNGKYIAKIGVKFSYPGTFKILQNSVSKLVLTGKDGFTIEMKKYIYNENMNNQTQFLNTQTVTYGFLINQGRAEIPNFLNAWVKLWDDNGVKKNQFFLISEGNVIEILVFPSDSSLMKEFDKILGSITIIN